MSERYNGWTNYETWCINLWIDNEESSQKYWREQAVRSRSTYELSRQLKEETHDAAPELEGFWADLLGAALSEVDWIEIAQSIREEAGCNDDTDEEDASA